MARPIQIAAYSLLFLLLSVFHVAFCTEDDQMFMGAFMQALSALGAFTGGEITDPDPNTNQELFGLS